MVMVMFMKGHGKTIKLLEKEYISIITEQRIMEHGLKINNMDRPKKHGQMGLNSRVIMSWAKNKEKGFLIGKMEVNMKANFSKII